jgi:GNAT superfamily N-acetyltransferase
MGRRFVPVSAETLPDLPLPCRECAFWEAGPAARTRNESPVEQTAAKRVWVERTMAGWGPCGFVAYVDDVPAGYVLYAPPAYVAGSAAFPTSPVSRDAVLLVAARVDDRFAGEGLGRVLVQVVAKDLVKRGVRAMEAYGSPTWEHCVLPAGFLEATGFTTVRPHARHPRLRLDLRTALTWREDVEGALGRIVGAVRPFPAGPSGVGARQVSRSGVE